MDRHDVQGHAQQIARIELLLHGLEARIVDAVACTHTLSFVLGQEVDIPAAGGVRRHILERAARPRAHALIVARFGPALPAQSTGWLAGLRDRLVGRALALLHERPAHDWTIDDLGRRVGLSRSALHERFVQYIGVPPMQYLAQWRMQAAARLLLETRATVSAIALDVGYDSEAAFARAFKRLVGKPPGAWRREREPAGT